MGNQPPSDGNWRILIMGRTTNGRRAYFRVNWRTVGKVEAHVETMDTLFNQLAG